MSWMKKLYETYDEIQRHYSQENNTLTPIAHTTQTAHIQIILNEQGEFQTAEVMPPKTAIILPVTEASESRTSGEEPHPLADKIQYVAQDYPKYDDGKKPYFSSYLEQLEAWCLSPYAHPKVQAVLKYIKQGTVMADLIRVGIFQQDENGKILNKWEGENTPKIFSTLPKTAGKIEAGSALVCWSVESRDDVRSQTWNDETIYQSWIDYLANQKSNQGFCFVQGTETAIMNLHPAKLRHTGDKAKLISSNDKSGYTFRGRFETAKESASVSATVSSKAHSALRWLIERQGIRNGEQVTVAWAVRHIDVPSPLQDAYDYLDDESDDAVVPVQSQANNDWFTNIGQHAATIIKQKLYSAKQQLEQLDNHEQISLLMLDSATPGRMSLTYYQEFLPNHYFDNLNVWVDDFSWYQRYTRGEGKEKTTVWAYLPPSPYAIAQTLYGATLSDSLKKQFYARLLPCIANGRQMPIPDDFVQRSFQVACNPMAYEHWEWERNVGVACALYKGSRARCRDLSKRRVYSMDIETEKVSRDYLFGRLLAVAERIEAIALQIAKENRATNAERYMQRFVSHPLSTWLTIETKLEPYKDRLRSNRMGFLRNREKEITEIMAQLDDLRRQTNCSLDEKLNGEFLLGYHTQKMTYRFKNRSAEEQDEQSETELN